MHHLEQLHLEIYVQGEKADGYSRANDCIPKVEVKNEITSPPGLEGQKPLNPQSYYSFKDCMQDQWKEEGQTEVKLREWGFPDDPSDKNMPMQGTRSDLWSKKIPHTAIN